MGKIARSVTNKQFPFSQLSNTVKQIKQVKMLVLKYGLDDELTFSDPPRDWSQLGGREIMFCEISKSI